MQQIHRRLLGVLALMVLGASAAWLMLWQEQHLSQEADSKVRQHKLFTITQTARINLLELRNRNGTFQLQREQVTPGQRQWLLSAPILAAADEGVVENLLEKVLQTQIFMRLGENTTNDKASPSPADEMKQRFGLAQPRMQLRLREEGGLDETIFIGRQNSFDDRLYVQLGNHGAFALIEGELLEPLNKTLFELREKRLIQQPTSSWTDVEVRNQQGKVLFALSKQNDWQLRQPLATRADEETVQFIFDALSGLRAKQFVREADANPGNLAEVGLDKPTYTVHIQAEHAAATTIVLGQRTVNQEQHYFASHQGKQQAVMELSSDWIFRKLSTPVGELRWRQLLTLENEQIHRFVLRRQGQQVDFTRQADSNDLGGKWRMTTGEQDPILDNKVQSLLHRITHLKADTLVQDETDKASLKSKGKEQPTLEVLLYDANNQLLDGLWVGAKSQDDLLFVGPQQQSKLGLIKATTIQDLSSDPADYTDKSAPTKDHTAEGNTIGG